MARTIRVDYLARVEGEGSLTIRFDGDRPKSVELGIFEPPRFFEGLLRGRSQHEAPDVTARICGICPVAYQMSACHAIEDAHGVVVPPELRALRRLLYCGEWIESHVLHVFLLHLPDFLGFQDSMALAREHPERVKAGLRMKKAGNALVALLGGREIHPINVRVGGFHRVPPKTELLRLVPELEWTRDAMLDAIRWMAELTFPDLEHHHELVALGHPDEYPFCEGRLVSTRGLDVAVRDWSEHFEEHQVERSTALHCRVRGRGPYLAGPLARFATSHDRLRPKAREAADAAGLVPPVTNPFRSLLVRAVEVVQVADEAVELLRSHVAPARPFVDVPDAAGTGHGCTEAPRGVLYHRYDIDSDGRIAEAQIVPPTSQNQAAIEADLFDLAPRLATMPHADATWLAEQAVRNYDPCISCSTHFLELRIERGGA